MEWSVVLGTCLVVVLGVLAIPSGAAAAARPILRASPSAAIVGETVALRVALGTRGIRVVRLEQARSGRWVVVARTRSDRAGVVRLNRRVTAGRSTFRVVAPPQRVGGRRLPGRTSRSAEVTATPQTVGLDLATDVAGQLDATVVVSHVRAGRVVRLQSDDGSGWATASSRTVTSSRTVRFPDVAATSEVAGRRWRAVLSSYGGLPAVVSRVIAPPTVAMAVTASDEVVGLSAVTTGTVERVRFYGDGVLIGEDTAAPWRLDWTPRLGTHDVAVRAVGPAESVLSAAELVTTTADVAPSGVAQGFALDEVQGGFDLPTSAATLPSGGVLVTEKGGLVRIVEPAEDGDWTVPRTVLDLSDEIHTEGDAGLIGLAVDPDVAVNGHVYVSYVRNDAAEGIDRRSQQVARFTWDGEVLDPASRHVVLGSVAGEDCWAEEAITTDDCVPLIGAAHTIGDLAFDGDGRLLVGIGDGSLYLSPNGLVDRTEALRVQDPDVLAGKVLRIDATTGRGVPDNPLFDGDGSSNASRVLAMGLRNPFRFTVHDGLLVIGDVGEGRIEEIDTLELDDFDESGAAVPNYGWPCREGDLDTPLGAVEDPGSPWRACAAIRSSDELRGPSYSYPHVGGGSVSGGVFLDAEAYPTSVRGRYVFGDYAQNFIRTAVVDHDGTVSAVQPFADENAAGGPVKFFTGPDGLVWSVSIMTGSLRRIVWTGDGLADRCPVGSFRRTFHDLDGPESAFDEEIPESDYAWLLPYAAVQLPTAVLAPPTCVDGIQLSTAGSPWLADGGIDDRAHPGDRFGTSWRGRIEVPAGTYRFTVFGSEWIRLWVDGEQVHSFFSNGWWPLGDRQHDVELGPGQHTVRAELVHGDNENAIADVTWERVGAPPTVSLALPTNGAVVVDGAVDWAIATTDPDGEGQPDVVLEVDFLHYTGDSFHAHPSARIEGEFSGLLEVSDAHAPGVGVVRLRAVAIDASGARSVSAPSYVCFEGGDVGPCR